MPEIPPSPCRICKTPTHNKPAYCDAHQHKKPTRNSDIKRGTPSDRGYDYAWYKIRARKLKADPMCQCDNCQGRIRVANMVHHIKPVETHYNLRLDWNNLLSMYRDCHEALHGRMVGAVRHIPPIGNRGG